SLIRSILIKSFKKLLVPQIALNFKKSLKDEKKSVFDFMSEKRLNFVFDSSADFLVAVFVKVLMKDKFSRKIICKKLKWI
ncbi:hypothetical protein MHBO_005005, partial [Bonamia ostreae]